MIRYQLQDELVDAWQVTVERLTSMTLAPLARELRVLRVSFACLDERAAQARETDPGDALRFRCRLRGRDRLGRSIDIETLDRDGERALLLALTRARREVIRSVHGARRLDPLRVAGAAR